MRIDVRDHVAATLGDELWPLYNDAFEELRSTAVQRHLMSRDEFDDVMADRRVAKVMAANAIHAADLVPRFSGAPGNVTEVEQQSPAANTQVARGSIVTLRMVPLV